MEAFNFNTSLVHCDGTEMAADNAVGCLHN